jgi:hypothetical protein
MPKMQPDDGGTSTRRERDSFLPDSADVAQGLSGPPFIHITAWLDRVLFGAGAVLAAFKLVGPAVAAVSAGLFVVEL